MRIEFRKNLWHGFFHQVADIDGIHILVVNDTQQGIQFVGRRVDDAQFVAGKMVGIECTDGDACNQGDGQQKTE